MECFLSHYNIDSNRIYCEGYSGGGETLSLVMAKRADLFTACVHASSKWDVDFQNIVDHRTPLYIVIGESDEYYGVEPSKRAYDQLYKNEGLLDDEIHKLWNGCLVKKRLGGKTNELI